MTPNQQPKTRPIAPTKPLADFTRGRFIKPSDLLQWKVTEITVTICEFLEVEVYEPNSNTNAFKPVLYFNKRDGKRHDQGYLLSAKADVEALAQATGAASVQEVLGKRIRIHLDTWKSKQVLRIDPTPLPAQASA